MIFNIGGALVDAIQWGASTFGEDLIDAAGGLIERGLDWITGGDEPETENYPPGWFDSASANKTGPPMMPSATLSPVVGMGLRALGTGSRAVGPAMRTITAGGGAMTGLARILVPAGAFIVGGELFDQAGQLLGYFSKTKRRTRRKRLLVQSDKEDLAYIAATLTPSDRKYFLAQLAARIGGR